MGFDLIGDVFGYILWFFFLIFKNYGLAIIAFTVFVRIILYPTSIKQQKSMAANSRLAGKQKEIQKKYEKDKTKMQEEMNKLYAKEGINPMGGCLTSIIPMILLMGIYYSVMMPLTSTLHVNADHVTAGIAYMNNLPGIGTTFNGNYGQITFMRIFPQISSCLQHSNIFNATEINSMTQFSHGFNFFGLDMLQVTNEHGVSWLLIIPFLCFATSFLSSLYMMRVQSNPMQNQQGCMKYMFLFFPLFSAYIAYSVPVAVGFYWIVSSVLMFFQSLLMQKFYSAALVTAKSEAARVAFLEQEEAKL
ncbi:MAG: YidC/Oxa1 family membrane protein insertase [Bacillota bacterium]|nr:YidC/Oxa1 family membrane protein insertase [Bacillota bacterium]